MARKVKNPKKIKNEILVICQGKTEDNYFKKFGNNIGKIKVISKKHDESPKRVVEYAIKLRTVETLSVWCVFDKDNFIDFEEAIRLANKNDIRCAYSNKDFELWFLMHMKKQEMPISDEEIKKKLTKYIGKKYEKNDERLYDYFSKDIDIAINNAKQVHQKKKITQGYKVYCDESCTTVYELVEYLKQF